MAHGKTARLNELNAMLNLDKRERDRERRAGRGGAEPLQR